MRTPWPITNFLKTKGKQLLGQKGQSGVLAPSVQCGEVVFNESALREREREGYICDRAIQLRYSDCMAKSHNGCQIIFFLDLEVSALKWLENSGMFWFLHEKP